MNDRQAKTDDKNKPQKCFCGKDIYKNDKCILHCNKDNWSKNGNKSEVDWNNLSENKELFWNELDGYVQKTNFLFDRIVFPKFKTKSSINFQNIFGSSTHFNMCYFCETADFENINFTSKVIFVDCIFREGARLSDCSFADDLVIDLGYMHSLFYAKNTKFSSKVLLEARFIDVKVDLINITIGSDFSISTRRGCISIGEPYEMISKLNINNLIVKKDAFLEFDFFLSKVSTFELNGISNFGHIYFNNLRLAEAILIDFGHNQLNDCIFQNILWGNKKNIKADRDGFGQLKFIYDKKSNYIEANEFYALEMKEREKELANQKYSEDWWVFKVGGCISNHSQSWAKALCWIFGFGVVMFFCYQWRTDNYAFDLEALFNYRQYCQGFIGFLDDFAKFMNPFSRKMDETVNTGYAIWLTHKVFSGFLVYHFIISLRRNTKR